MKPVDVSAKQVAALEKLCRSGAVSTLESDRIANSTDCWPATKIDIRDARLGVLPAVVVAPGNAEEVAAVLRYAMEQELPVTPYAEGSGVCGGAIPIHGGISLDTKRLTRVLDLDDKSQLLRAESGINGEKLERYLNARGFTLGHFPSSIYTSTLGGWLAARSAGQLSSLHGKIEDMVQAIEVALPDGRIAKELVVPARATGPNWQGLFLGSEGTLGVITAASMKIKRAPEHRAFSSFLFSDLMEGWETFRELLQAGIRPAVMRLYDEVDTYLAGSSGGGEARPGEVAEGYGDVFAAFYEVLRGSGFSRALRGVVGGTLGFPGLINRALGMVPKQCKCIMVFEGEEDRCLLEQELATQIALGHGAEDTGEGPARKWLSRRYAVSYRQSAVFDNFAFADTMEVAASWSRLPRLYLKVRQALSRHALVMAHFSHAYHEGCSIYFTFVGAGANRQVSQARYRNCWRDALAAASEAGGTITHHHGVGLLKAGSMETEHGAAMEILRAAKAHLDPQGLMNPGKLGV